MSLVALDGTPLVIFGGLHEGIMNANTALASVVADAANEAIIYIGQIFTEDGASHTINTSGSSSLGWRSGAVTFASGTTRVKVGLAAVDATTGPPARAVNSSDVITFDVSRTHIGNSGTITATAWQENVPDAGSKTIAHGDLVAFAVQMTVRGGTDLVNVQQYTNTIGAAGSVRPSVTSYLAAAYANSANGLPNAVITFSDGTFGFFYGGMVATTTASATTWSNASSPNEYGNYFQMPFPCKIYGFAAALNIGAGADADIVLYSDPLGTPVNEKAVTFDANQIGIAQGNRWEVGMFASPYTAAANQPLAGIYKPTTATTVASNYISVNAAAHMKSYSLGTNCYAVSRASGAFAAVNSNKDRYTIGLLIGAFSDGAGGGGSVFGSQGGVVT